MRRNASRVDGRHAFVRARGAGGDDTHDLARLRLHLPERRTTDYPPIRALREDRSSIASPTDAESGGDGADGLGGGLGRDDLPATSCASAAARAVSVAFSDDAAAAADASGTGKAGGLDHAHLALGALRGAHRPAWAISPAARPASSEEDATCWDAALTDSALLETSPISVPSCSRIAP